MIFEEGIEVLDRFLQVAALVEDSLGHLDETAFLVCDNSSPARHIVNERNFPEGVTGVVVYTLLFPLVFLIFSFHIVDAFQHDVKVLSSVTLAEDHFANAMLFEF